MYGDGVYILKKLSILIKELYCLLIFFFLVGPPQKALSATDGRIGQLKMKLIDWMKSVFAL